MVVVTQKGKWKWTIWCYHSDSKKTSKEKMNGMQSLVSMKPIYRKNSKSKFGVVRHVKISTAIKR
jgi:hypothetical protein